MFHWVRLLIEPEDVVWDLGANQRLFTFAASYKAGVKGKVVAFEPDLFLTSLLERTLMEKEERSDVTILPIAVSGRNGVAEFAIASKDRALNHLAGGPGYPQTQGTRQKMKVLACILDWLSEYLPEPNVIKIDMEGAEADVVSSAGIVLGKFRPVIIVEVASEKEKPIGDIFCKHKYRLLDSRGNGEEIVRPAWNTVAVPFENFDFVARRFHSGSR